MLENSAVFGNLMSKLGYMELEKKKKLAKIGEKICSLFSFSP